LKLHNSILDLFKPCTLEIQLVPISSWFFSEVTFSQINNAYVQCRVTAIKLLCSELKI
jgi:hypothetical protein